MAGSKWLKRPPRPIQAPYETGPRDRPSSRAGHPVRDAEEHRKAIRAEAEV